MHLNPKQRVGERRRNDGFPPYEKKKEKEKEKERGRGTRGAVG
jgi:hypothetical protein